MFLIKQTLSLNTRVLKIFTSHKHVYFCGKFGLLHICGVWLAAVLLLDVTGTAAAAKLGPRLSFNLLVTPAEGRGADGDTGHLGEGRGSQEED